MSLDSALLTEIRAFLNEDPDAQSRRLLEELLAQGTRGDPAAEEELRSIFSGRLGFGTAGVRGRLGPGTARMNRVVVSRWAWGLARHLRETAHPVQNTVPGVVVGFDGRTMGRVFAEDIASIMAGQEIPVYLFDEPIPTPLCSFAVRYLRAAAGVMVTASHNPPCENGLKIFSSSGGQVIPPQDLEISEMVAQAPSLNKIPRIGVYDAYTRGLRRSVARSLEKAYLDAVLSASVHAGVGQTTPLSIVYTALQGVGAHWVIEALRQAGFDGVATVAQEADPDPAFRSVASPNPEDEVALARSLEEATHSNAELVLATDPDADRLAVAVPKPDSSGWRILTGDEVGVLLGFDSIKHSEPPAERKFVVTTIVSSNMLTRIAEREGVGFARTLTGFKWIASAAFKREALGDEFLFGYEEALGYAFTSKIPDKDGISAALRIVELASYLKSKNLTLLDQLHQLWMRYGLSRTLNWSEQFRGARPRQAMKVFMQSLRRDPPHRLGSLEVSTRCDYLSGEVWENQGVVSTIQLPRANVITFTGHDNTRLTIRPSGTEPKIKFYLEATCEVRTASSLEGASRKLDGHLQGLKDAVMRRLKLTDRRRE